MGDWLDVVGESTPEKEPRRPERGGDIWRGLVELSWSD